MGLLEKNQVSMKVKKLLDNTNNSGIYRKALIANSGCGYCGLGKGCNRNRDRGLKSWKQYRKRQWH